MSSQNRPNPPASMNLADIYYILFRHKWKILVIWTLAVITTVALWFFWPTEYKSTAKLFVRYILENKTLNPVGSDTSIRTPDRDGSGIINSEVEILNSFDLALQVADAVGPERILSVVGGGSDRHHAAGLIRLGLTVEAPTRGAVIQVEFKHPDANLVQPILNQLVASYLKKHAEIHQAAGTLNEALSKQTDQFRTELAQTEQELRKAQLEIGITSLEDAKKSYSGRLARIQDDLFRSEAELAGRLAVLERMTNWQAPDSTSPPPALQTPPADAVAEYKGVCALLDNLEKQQVQYLSYYTASNFLVGITRESIAKQRKIKAELEREYPGLIHTPTQGNSSPAPAGGFAAAEIIAEIGRVRALESTLAVQTQQLAQVRQELTRITDMEGKILELQRKKELQEQNYRYFSANLERARFDEAFGSGRISNISEIQKPSPPFKDTGKLSKILLVCLAAGFGLGPALAFVIEMHLDRSVRRPLEVESRLNLPLFLSIPRSVVNGKLHLKGGPARRLLTLVSSASSNGTESNGTPETSEAVAPWKPHHALRPFFEALRDRLITFFEIKNLTHKPKLVAVTSCEEGSGVSTIAGGLAAALSETGDGNVLLVDMHDHNRGSARYFHHGELECGLDDALEREKRDQAMVQEHLYVVSEGGGDDRLPRILHKRFSNLIPRLKASDYDYIIFDMPPVSQISSTTRIAPYMDMIFVVAESEKTDRDALKRATALLAESKANVSVVLNKTRSYVPRQLHPES